MPPLRRCLADCGRDAHDHVRRCPSSLHPGGHAGTLLEFNNVHRDRRRAAVLQYLGSPAVAAGDREAVVAAVAADLKELGIKL